MYEYESANRRWRKLAVGTVSLVKDCEKRSYFLRLFEMEQWQCVFEQELYIEFQYSADRAFFHSFSADASVCGLNFADEIDARQFGDAVLNKIEQRESKRTGERTLSCKRNLV